MASQAGYLMESEFPFPRAVERSGSGTGKRSAGGELVAVVGADEAAGGGESGEALAKGGVPDAAGGANLGEGKRPAGVGERAGDALVHRGGLRLGLRAALDDVKRKGVAALRQRECDGGDGRGGAVLDCEGEIVAVASEIEVGVAPGVELRGAAQGLAGAGAAAALLRVMHECDGDAVAPLQFAQVGEDRGDLAGGVLVDPVEPNEGVEDKEARPELRHRLVEARPVGVQVDPHDRRGDHLNVEVGEVHAGCGADPLEPPSHDMERVLGGEEKNAARARHREAAQAGRAGRDRHGKVEGEEGLAALRLASDDPHRLLGPETGDEPAPLLGAGREPVCGLDREQAHLRRPAAFASRGGGAAKVSRKSFSSRWRASRCAATARRSPAMFMRARWLPWAWSQRVATSSGVMSFAAPAFAIAWRRQSASSSGGARSSASRTRIRLPSGRSSSERKRSTRRPSPARTMVRRTWESNRDAVRRRSSPRTGRSISCASSMRSSGLESAESMWVCQRSRRILEPAQRLCGWSSTPNRSPISR